ncbi:hypothetical protein [Flavobacterium tructae]|uniref:Nucleotide-diphospho-sugar transferase domain-containing protein n=1 Tax=Flavobacterium tructae TaxID=1114873 RepID=A0A1S1J8I2_9FLAO|nr:hypothetical protein [Flavobacterium tructae]OHT44603.1 hypothetical protein BHE19_12905 [Flavobacterium tructae]OXB19259.1 hypothetical protein B0A71_11965 [Flavobacterium tructae]
MVDNKFNIAILSTVINFDLYDKSSPFFPQDVQKYVIDGRNGMHGLKSIFYMMKMLKNKNIEWLIMADEDVLFQDSEIVFDIINKMKSEDYTVCGVRDGGMIAHRTYNPYLINTFFSILNFKELEKIWNKDEILKNDYSLENEFDDDLTNLKWNFDTKSLYEPYYCFYLWLRRKNKKFLFLDTEMNEDQIANSITYNNRVFLHHTWFARAYGKNDEQTKRINVLFDLLNSKDSKTSDPVIFKDQTFLLIQKIKKTYRKILMRLKR